MLNALELGNIRLTADAHRVKVERVIRVGAHELKGDFTAGQVAGVLFQEGMQVLNKGRQGQFGQDSLKKVEDLQGIYFFVKCLFKFY